MKILQTRAVFLWFLRIFKTRGCERHFTFMKGLPASKKVRSLLELPCLTAHKKQTQWLFVIAYLKLSAYTVLWHAVAQIHEQIIRGFKRFRYLFFKQSREKKTDSHKCIVAKGTRVDRVFVHNFWKFCMVRLPETFKFYESEQQSRHNCAINT